MVFTFQLSCCCENCFTSFLKVFLMENFIASNLIMFSKIAKIWIFFGDERGVIDFFTIFLGYSSLFCRQHYLISRLK